MKRSRINAIMQEAADLIARHGFVLPPFAHWSPDDFRARAPGTRRRRSLCPM